MGGLKLEGLAAFWQEISSRPDFWGFVCIPLVAAVVTWVHVWFAIQMVFYPIEYVGVMKPWLGWQGIIPRKAGKMAGIVVDKTLSKLGSIDEVFREMEPEKIAGHVSRYILSHAEEMIDEIMAERNQVLWENLPPVLKKRVYAHVRRQVPDVMDAMISDMSAHINELVDVKHMVVSRMEGDKALMVRVFKEVGANEIKFIINSSFWIGMFFGTVQMILWYFFPSEWALPLYGAALGYLTNWVAINMVFRPLNPIPLGPWSLQGVFLKRQAQVAEHFAHLTTLEMMSIKQIMAEMFTGVRAEKTRKLVKKHMTRMLDGGVVRTVMQMAVGMEGFANLKQIITSKAVDMSLAPLGDPAFNRERSKKIEAIFSTRIKALSPAEFQDLLRPAFQEDEWILMVLGGIFGFIAGWIQFLTGFK